jgi:hypothetical protein
MKRRQRVAANGELIASPRPPQAMTVLSPCLSPSFVAAVSVVDSLTVFPNAVTPATTRGGTKRTSGDRLTNRAHNIRRRKGIVLNEARILGFLRARP